MIKQFNDYEQEMLKDVVSRGEALYHLYVRLREGSLLKSVRAYMVCKAVEEQGEIINAIPTLPELEEGQFELDFTLTITGDPDPSALQHALEGIAEIEKVEITPVELQDENEVTVIASPLFPFAVSPGNTRQPPVRLNHAPGGCRGKRLPDTYC